MGGKDRIRLYGRGEPVRRFACDRPDLLLLGMYLGLFLGFVVCVALFNGWLGFNPLDPLGQGAMPLPAWVVNVLLVCATVLLFVGAAALVPYEARVEEDGLVLVRLLGELRLVGEEIRGVTPGAPRFCLVHTRGLAYLVLPYLGDLGEFQGLVLRMIERGRG